MRRSFSQGESQGREDGYREYMGDLAMDAQALEDEEEKWYAMGGRSSHRSDMMGANDDGDDSVGVVTSVIIFIPPRFHLLFKFHVSDESTVVRIRTDNWKLLSELDAFFASWGID